VEKALVFAHSPYQTENQNENKEYYTLSGQDIFYLRKTARAELYRNTVRLKINLPTVFARQEIWRYEDPPVFYDNFLQAHYPFMYPLFRKIEGSNYEARYRVTDENGKERDVIYADEIDTKEEAEERLDYDGGPFVYSHYDITTYHDRAILTLQKENDGDLYYASIHGRPIILDLNRSCFMRNLGEIELYGTAALNVTGSYFSEDLIDGINGMFPHYEDWVMRELAERIQRRREFTVKTHRGLFHARVGAGIKLGMRNEELGGKINAISLRYRKDRAFVAAFRIYENFEE
jgi:hypothetical protein